MNELPGSFTRPRGFVAMLLAGVALALIAPSAAPDERDESQGEIRVLSSPPDLVSGSDALVQVELRGHRRNSDVRVTLNGQDNHA